MPKNQILAVFILLLCFQSAIQAQQLKQSIRGRVIDKVSKYPLPRANISLINGIDLKGTISDEQGFFVLKDVPVGRQNLKITYLGYEDVVFENLTISSAKELVLTIELEEKIYHSGEVVIRAPERKDKTNNKMATVSARKFTVEESNKYPSAYGDISRMVVNYSGVQASSNQRNDIIIRGNNPSGLLWRIEGVDIPNPNHFSEVGTSGGVFTMVNNNVLSNSDFFTSVFPADYGNALSGVFDLKMKNGNSGQREYTFQSGFNGLEIGMEGPLSFSSENMTNSSYLAHYRLSTVEIIEALGVNFAGYVPRFQDLSVKIDIPNPRIGKFSFFAIGGTSYIDVLEKGKEQEDWTYVNAGENVYITANMGVAGLSYRYSLSDKIFLETTVAVSGTINKMDRDSFHIEDDGIYRIYDERFQEIRYTFRNCLVTKINTRNNISTGIALKYFQIHFKDRRYEDAGQYIIPVIQSQGEFALLNGFTQWQYKFMPEWSMSTGLHFQYFTYNSTYSIEPRFGLRWRITSNQSINTGIGMHSQLQPLYLYEIETRLTSGETVKTNKNLDFSKAVHYVLGYDLLINKYLKINIETYYHYLYNIPVKEGIPAYSLINAGADYISPKEDSLVNKGKGENYGIEFTLEKYFNKHYYILYTTSLFNSKYIGYDNIERNTAFAANYIMNLLGGYEFKVGKNHLMGFDIKTTWSGGRRYVPVDMERSDTYLVYNWDDAYKKRRKDYFTINAAIHFTLNRPKFSLQFLADFQNLTNHQNIFIARYDPTSHTIQNEYQLGFLPSGKIKVEF